jgi:transcriptional regulator with XRE-family HTH domain
MLRNLRKLRKEKGLSQQKLAEALGVSQQSINKYENHNVEPDIAMLIRMADYFDTSIDCLVGREKNTEEQNEEKSFCEKELMAAFRKMSKPARKSVEMVIRAVANAYPIDACREEEQ